MTERGEMREADIAIVGGGMVGLTAAAGLASQGFEVVVIDREAPEKVTDKGFDGRCSAIAAASRRLLEALGIWQHLAGEAGPIEEIRVSDGPSRLFLHFDRRMLGAEPLGHMVENRHTRLALEKHIVTLPGLCRIAPAELDHFQPGPGKARLGLKDGRTIATSLVIAADGRNSRMRREAGIRTPGWRYDQVGIVATISHELPHCAIAHERFLPDGPFAILPLPDNRSSLVWTARADMEHAIMGLGERAFEAEIAARIGGFLGGISVIGPRFSYPLGLHLAERYIDERLCLIGDAAHGIHPIAGQGLNLGLRDVAALIEVLVAAMRRGEDIGAAFVLERYQRWRRTDSLVLAAATDGLNRLFSNDVPPVRLARDLGLAAVQRLPALKRFFMEHARGTFGDLPKLLKGEPL
ncbi:MAG: UbiH/UbiF/VisC/COQ6 family ubiquinone biosynthesis hydroxylase [Rhodothalassiaceae bacterium]